MERSLLVRPQRTKGYTQVELTDKLGIIQVMVSDYERDKLRPYHEMIVRMSKALDMSIDELIGVKMIKAKKPRSD